MKNEKISKISDPKNFHFHTIFNEKFRFFSISKIFGKTQNFHFSIFSYRKFFIGNCMKNENFEIIFFLRSKKMKIFIEICMKMLGSKIFVDRFSFWPNFLPDQAITDRLKVLTSLGAPLSIPKRSRASRPCKYHVNSMQIFFTHVLQIPAPGLWGGPRGGNVKVRKKWSQCYYIM